MDSTESKNRIQKKKKSNGKFVFLIPVSHLLQFAYLFRGKKKKGTYQLYRGLELHLVEITPLHLNFDLLCISLWMQ